VMIDTFFEAIPGHLVPFAFLVKFIMILYGTNTNPANPNR